MILDLRTVRHALLAGMTAVLLSACSSENSSDSEAPPSTGSSGSEQVPIVTPPATGSQGEQGTDLGTPPTPNSQLDCAP